MKYKVSLSILFLPLLMIGCVGSGNSAPTTGLSGDVASVQEPVTSSPTSTPAPAPAPAPTATTSPATPRAFKTDALLFNGQGTWSTEVSSLMNIMHEHGMTYKAVGSAELDGMSVDEIAEYGMLIIPGGSGGTIAGSVSADTHARLREAVQKRGVGYIGFCAGAFVAAAPAPAPGRDVSYGFGVVDGPVMDYYYLENQGTSMAMTMATFADGSKRDLLWYGGPVTPNTPGGVIAKYPNGDPAITQIWSGKGFVIVSGPHPAAPRSVSSSSGLKDSDGEDFDLTWTLLSAVLQQKPLQAF